VDLDLASFTENFSYISSFPAYKFLPSGQPQPLSQQFQPPSLPLGSIPIAASPTGATESGNIVTITTTVPHGFFPNQPVVIAGVGVEGYNGTFTISSVGSGPNPTTFTYTATKTGLAPSGGGNATSTPPMVQPNVTSASTGVATSDPLFTQV